MTNETTYDEGLEEIWRIKREIAAEYPTLDDYFKGMADYRLQRLREGATLVRLWSDSIPVDRATTPAPAARPGKGRIPVVNDTNPSREVSA